jgi:hypothetical protein
VTTFAGQREISSVEEAHEIAERYLHREVEPTFREERDQLIRRPNIYDLLNNIITAYPTNLPRN